MSLPVLETKFYVPPARANIVRRPHLLERLNEGLRGPLTLIAAPAGYGKTTLMAEWHAGSGRDMPVAWLSLDASDNDPARFWYYLVSALETLQPGIGGDALTMLASLQPPPIESLLTVLINDVSAFLKDFVLALDDVHVITAPEIYQGIDFLLEHLPPQMHLGLISRADPPIALSRLRVRGNLCEIRGRDLRFSIEETTAFLNIVMNLQLSEEEIAALEARTEGWIAGLLLATLLMQGRDSKRVAQFIESFSGSHHYVIDYLAEEVLHQQTKSIQDFLLKTSILERFNGPLCEAITGQERCQQTLHKLEHSNLFLLPLDNERRWFRYHSLFAEFLRVRLHETQPDLVAELYHRATEWHEHNGDISDAINYAIIASDMERAASLIEQLGHQLFMGHEMTTLFKWAQTLPTHVIANHPKLNVMAAWAAHATGHPYQCEEFVRIIEDTAGISVDDFLDTFSIPQGVSVSYKSALIEGAVIRSRLAVDSFDLERTFALGERVLPYLTRQRDEEPFVHNPPSVLRDPQIFILGLAHKYRGELSAAFNYLSEAEQEARQNDILHVIALSLGHLGDVQVMQGKLHQAEKTFLSALKTARSLHPHTSGFFGMASIGLGNLAYEWNNLSTAFDYLQAGIQIGKLWNSWECLLPGYIGMAQLHCAQGEWEKAYSSIDELLNLPEHNVKIFLPTVEAWKALISLRQGDITPATIWGATFDPQVPDDFLLRREQNALILVRLWLRQRKFVEAEELLKHLMAGAEKGGRQGRIIEILILQALTLHAQQQLNAALQVILQAFVMAETEGYVRVFLDEGEPMVVLIRKAASRGIAPQYVSRLLSEFDKVSGLTLPTRHQSLIQPLTEREIQVVKLIVAGKSNQEIADALVIALGTVKRHIFNIYSKLDVRSRTECVARARALHLLE